MNMSLLDGVRVLDLSGQIAGPYCTKLFADTGADVVKIETEAGDPLRSWSASGVDLDGRDGALFQFLNASKRSVSAELHSAESATLLAGADLLVEDRPLADKDLGWLSAEFPHLSVLSITPFGRTGPWAERPWTEFTLQALCGSIASRGTLDREPFFAGGRLGEWVAGTFGAVAGMAALTGARRGSVGERIDLSIFECMSIVMGGIASPSLQASMSGSQDDGVPPRIIEIPSIEPTADDCIGFCTVTAQQFSDFLVLIERPDLLEDADLVTFAGRNRRRAEFLSMVWEWTKSRSTAEIEELAGLFRIPVAPIGRPATISQFPHFAEREVYVRNPAGFVQPRPPYRVDGQDPSLPEPAPRHGEHTATVQWDPREQRPGESTDTDGAALPLRGIRIIDLTAFWAGPAATLTLAALGAEVIKVESVQRPDAMRYSSVKPADEPSWWEWGSTFQANNLNKKGITLDLRRPEGVAMLLDLVRNADAMIENFSPRVLENFGISWDALREVNPQIVLVRMPAFGLSGPWRDRTGFAQTMEQISGMAWMTGFADGPPVIPRGPCDPLAGMHAAFLLLAALEDRRRTGHGHVVESTMVETALNVAAEVVIEYSAYDRHLTRDGNRGPVSAPQGLYACRSDTGKENWLALAVQNDHQWEVLLAVMGRPAWAHDASLGTAAGRREARELIDEELSAWCVARDVNEIVDSLVRAGVAAARVIEPAKVPDNVQMRSRGFVETFDHGVVGHHEVLSMPFRLASSPGRWFHSPAPTVGQHNHEVLQGLLGITDDEFERLTEISIIGNQPGHG
jgi:crotonobetainyl-CoA:carnitine CoA-transferase CaiB-like acyl-CoA transferase